LEYIKKFVPTANVAPLAGNTIGTDRMFIARYMPELDAHLHYRNIDVSTIRNWLSAGFHEHTSKLLKKKVATELLLTFLSLLRSSATTGGASL